MLKICYLLLNKTLLSIQKLKLKGNNLFLLIVIFHKIFVWFLTLLRFRKFGVVVQSVSSGLRFPFEDFLSLLNIILLFFDLLLLQLQHTQFITIDPSCLMISIMVVQCHSYSLLFMHNLLPLNAPLKLFLLNK